MNNDEMQQHNDTILKKLEFDKLLVDVRTETDPVKRANVLIYAFCHMLNQQRTAGRIFDHAWIVANIGRPDEEWTETNGDQIMWYNLAFPSPPEGALQGGCVTLKNGRLAHFARMESIQSTTLATGPKVHSPCDKRATQFKP